MIAGKSEKEVKQKAMKIFKDLQKIYLQHHIKLKEDTLPILHPHRRISSSLQEKIKE